VAGLLKEKGAGDIVVFAGGIIPSTDVEELRSQGVGAVFGPGTTIDQIVSFLRDACDKRHRID